MSLIIQVKCTNCGKEQKMELRNIKITEYEQPDLTKKRKKCVWCEKSFKISKDSIQSKLPRI